MGRPSARSRLEKKLAAKKKKKSETMVSSVEEILEKAQGYVDEYNYELAEKFLQKALELDPDNVTALEMAATLLLEAGDVEKAKQCLGRAVTVRPEVGHSKYFTLAQLFDGQESLSIYEQGIRILERTLEETREEDKVSELSRELSKAYCALTELFITDLCDEDDAELRCRQSIEKAIAADPTNPEALQVKARYLLIKEEFCEAISLMTESLSLWLPKYQSIIDNKPDVGSFDPVEVCPLSYPTRIDTAKILIELEQFDSATQVLEGLIEEDDEVVESWYLLGWLNRLRAEGVDSGYNGNARYYLSKAKKVHASNPTQDTAIIEHIEEILNEMGPENEEEDDNDDDDDDDDDNPENWEDLESSDDDEEEVNMDEK